jgi:hypothetical protein
MDTFQAMPEDFPWELDPIDPTAARLRPPDVFDKDRRFLFGYSNGGMLAHRLVREMPDYWAGIWSMSASCGGVPHAGLPIGPPGQEITVNLPTEGDYGVSLFAHHGVLDNVVPPGEIDTADFDLQTAPINSPGYVQALLAGFPNAEDYLVGLLPLAQMWRGYTDYNALNEAVPLVHVPGLEPEPVSRPDSTPGFDPPSPLSSWGAWSLTWGGNPTVQVYLDNTMDHLEFVEHENRYFFAFDVWKFFREHPRVLRLEGIAAPPGAFP